MKLDSFLFIANVALAMFNIGVGVSSTPINGLMVGVGVFNAIAAVVCFPHKSR